MNWRLLVGVPLGGLLLRLLGLTWRFEVSGAEAWQALRASGRGYVLVLWHGQQLPFIYHWRGRGVHVVVSEHRDGEIVTRIIRGLGNGAIRGSSSRGGARALVEMIRMLKEGHTVVVTPDGPRGPARRFAPGALVSAQRAGVPIVLATMAASRAWRLRNWDAFSIPKPFARIRIRYSTPIAVQGATPAEAAADATRLEGLMADLEGLANA